jgi:hypothetical protein
VNVVASKTCSKCGDTLSLSSFQPNGRYADGYVTWCKPCAKQYRADHYVRNKEKTRAQNAKWHAANKEKRNSSMRVAYAANPARHSERVKANKARKADQYREYNRINARKRRESRIDVRLRSRISSQFRYCLATGKGGRTSEVLLGYSINELRTHLERQFLPGMSWANFGDWHIDHIVPLASFTITSPDDPELRRAWALTNLRPLWAADNIAKRDKRVTLL